METKPFGKPYRKFGNEETSSRPSPNRRRRPLGKYRWAVYPDYWKDSWGKKPLLGHVIADDEFYAIREAYNRGLLPVNFTFQPQVVNVGLVEQN